MCGPRVRRRLSERRFGSILHQRHRAERIAIVEDRHHEHVADGEGVDRRRERRVERAGLPAVTAIVAMISENSPRVVIPSATRVDRRAFRSNARPARKPVTSFVGVVTTTASAISAATLTEQQRVGDEPDPEEEHRGERIADGFEQRLDLVGVICRGERHPDEEGGNRLADAERERPACDEHYGRDRPERDELPVGGVDEPSERGRAELDEAQEPEDEPDRDPDVDGGCPNVPAAERDPDATARYTAMNRSS